MYSLLNNLRQKDFVLPLPELRKNQFIMFVQTYLAANLIYLIRANNLIPPPACHPANRLPQHAQT